MTRSLPFVTVVIPTHQRAALLSRLLDSLAAQTYPPTAFEVLVVHNVGSDNTKEIVDRFAECAAMKVAYHAKNARGPTPSREFGARIAKGTIIAFIDDDCVATPDWLTEGVRAFAPGVGLVQGRTLPNPEQPRRLIEKTIDIPAATPYFETCNIFYSKEAFERVGGFSQEFADQRVFTGEDVDLGWKVKENGYATTFCPGALAYHEVFRVSAWVWFVEPRIMYIWPYLAKKHPGLRDYMYCRYFLSRRTALFNLFALGLIFGLLAHPAAWLLTLPYVVLRMLESGKGSNPLVRLARLLAGIPRAFFFFGALLAGSVRYRSVLL